MSAGAATAPPIPEAASATAPRTFWQAARRRFGRDAWALVGLGWLVIVGLAALGAPWITGAMHRSPYRQGMMDSVTVAGRAVEVVSSDGLPLGPGPGFPLGADLAGRDVLSRMIHGARISLGVAGGGTLLALLAGVFIGLVAGWWRGPVDHVLSRLVDAMMSIPVLLLAIALGAVLGGGSPGGTILILALVNWTYLARIVRAETLKLREQDFIEAARATGAGDLAILSRHLLPNLLGPLMVFATLSLASNILLESALSFLGVGVRPPTPSWGNLIEEGLVFHPIAWWLTLFPGMAILLTVVSLNVVGDALRELVAPLRGEGGAG